MRRLSREEREFLIAHEAERRRVARRNRIPILFFFGSMFLMAWYPDVLFFGYLFWFSVIVLIFWIVFVLPWLAGRVIGNAVSRFL